MQSRRLPHDCLDLLGCTTHLTNLRALILSYMHMENSFVNLNVQTWGQTRNLIYPARSQMVNRTDFLNNIHNLLSRSLNLQVETPISAPSSTQPAIRYIPRDIRLNSCHFAHHNLQLWSSGRY